MTSDRNTNNEAKAATESQGEVHAYVRQISDVPHSCGQCTVVECVLLFKNWTWSTGKCMLLKIHTLHADT